MVEAKDALGQVVYVSRVEDCCENEGGYWCQVYADEFLDYELDDFCVHPEDCDCSDESAVDEYIKKYVAEECEFDLSEYREWLEEYTRDFAD